MLEKIKAFLFKNTSEKQTVAKNTIWLTISNFGGRLIKAILIIYAARILGTAGYGVFSYALTFAGFVGILVDPGINYILVRDSAKASPEERRKIFSTAFAIKVILLVAAAIVVLLIGPRISTLPGAAALLPIVAVILVFDAIREFFFSFFRSIEKMEWEAGSFIITNIAIVIFGFALMRIQPTAAYLAWGYAAGIICGAIVTIFVLRDYLRELFSGFSTSLAGSMIQSAWPFAVSGALGILFTNTDILIVSWMKTASDVGIYSAAIRIIQVLYLVPGVIQLSTLPLFSRLAKSSIATGDNKFRGALEQTVGIIFLVSVPMAIGGILLGTQIMSFVFGSAFGPGGSSFKLLMATLIVDYPGAVIINAIFTYGNSKKLAIATAIGAPLNVAFDLLFIPRFGIAGSALSTLIAQTTINCYLWYTMKKINYFTILPHLKKIGVAAVMMTIVTGALIFIHTNLIVNILISAIVYFVALKLLREPLLEATAKIFFGSHAAAA